MNHYPIRTLSELTGVPSTTLRAWERRYGLLKPHRTAKGHRQYRSEDIELVREIVRLLKDNHTISEAIRVIRNPELRSTVTRTSEGHWLDYQQRILRSVEGFNQQNLDKTYNEALALYPIDMVTEHVIIPVLNTLGERWQSRTVGIAEEHFFSAFLRNKLGARLHHDSPRARGSRILVSCLPGEYHELGVLLFCIAALGHGYQVLYLGTNMPPAQLALVAQRTDVSAILLSGTRIAQWGEQLKADLQECIQSAQIPLMFGGEFSEIYKTQIEALGAHALGSEYVPALEKMESVIPVFTKR